MTLSGCQSLSESQYIYYLSSFLYIVILSVLHTTTLTWLNQHIFRKRRFYHDPHVNVSFHLPYFEVHFLKTIQEIYLEVGILKKMEHTVNCQLLLLRLCKMFISAFVKKRSFSITSIDLHLSQLTNFYYKHKWLQV